MPIVDILIILGVLFLTYKIYEFFPMLLAKMRVHKFKKTLKNCKSGFGVIYNGKVVMDSEKPVLFEHPQDAIMYTRERRFGAPHPLFPNVEQKIKICFLKVDQSTGQLKINEVKFASA